MPNSKKISSLLEAREQIVKLIIDDVKSQSEVSRHFGILRTTVRDIIKKYIESGEIVCSRRGGARITVFNAEIQDSLQRLFQDDDTVTLQEFKTKLELNVSLVTICRWLKKLGYTWKITRTICEKRNTLEVKLERLNYVRWFNS